MRTRRELATHNELRCRRRTRTQPRARSPAGRLSLFRSGFVSVGRAASSQCAAGWPAAGRGRFRLNAMSVTSISAPTAHHPLHPPPCVLCRSGRFLVLAGASRLSLVMEVISSRTARSCVRAPKSSQRWSPRPPLVNQTSTRPHRSRLASAHQHQNPKGNRPAIRESQVEGI